MRREVEKAFATDAVDICGLSEVMAPSRAKNDQASPDKVARDNFWQRFRSCGRRSHITYPCWTSDDPLIALARSKERARNSVGVQPNLSRNCAVK